MTELRPLSPDEAYALQDRPSERPVQTRVKAWRLFELQSLLREKPRSVRELAAHFQVSARSVQRDLDALEQNGQGLGREGNRYFLEARPAALNAVEALAIHAAARLLYHHTPAFNRHYREGLVKLAGMLPEPARSVALRSSETLPDRPDESQALELVAQAWFERRVLRFDYLKPGKGEAERGFELQVYFVEVSRTNLALYVIGYERAHRKALRTYKLSRMQGLHLLRDTFDDESLLTFDPRNFLSDAWGVVGGGEVGEISVRLRFAATAAYRLLEGGYPHMQLQPPGEDGSLEVTVRTGVDGSGLPRELMPWILGWGPRVEVLSPANVRAHWLNEARAVVAQFGGDTF